MPGPNDYIPDWTEDNTTREHLEHIDEAEEEPIDRYNQDEDLYKNR